jgi:glycine hydroxymethyltransferase
MRRRWLRQWKHEDSALWRPNHISGKDASGVLDHVQITVNKNLIPFDPAPPTVTSGIRIGTPAVTTRGMKEAQMKQVAEFIDQAVINRSDEGKLADIRAGVQKLTDEFPIYKDLDCPSERSEESLR